MVRKISIIGTGFIGISLCIAIKKANQDLHIVGYDLNHDHVSKAYKLGAVDKIEVDISKVVKGMDMVILSTPVKDMRNVMQAIAGNLGDECVVTDTGSTKDMVARWAEEILPFTANFVGGHPLVSAETARSKDADADLFRAHPYCVISGCGTRKEAVERVIELVDMIGAFPYFISSKEHDSFAAAVNQLPFILLAAIMGCTSKSASWRDMSPLAPNAFKEITGQLLDYFITRRDIDLTNLNNIVYWIDVFIKELREIQGELMRASVSEESLDKVFQQALEALEKWLSGVPTHSNASPDTDYGSVGHRMSELFLGSALIGSQRRIRDMLSSKKKSGQDRK